MRAVIAAVIVALALPPTAPAGEVAAEQAVAVDGRTLSLTIYGGDLALVRDRRGVVLRQGLNRLAFDDIGAQVLPASVMLRPADNGTLRVVERLFDRDVLSPPALVERSVGGEVWVEHLRPATGEIVRRRGILLTAGDPVLVEVEGRVETVDAGALAFDRVPAGLRRRPTLAILVDADKPGRRDVELAYLTAGLTWRADYVAELAGDTLDLEALVTVSNDSGTPFAAARLSFVAGEINRVADVVVRQRSGREAAAMAAPAPMAAPDLAREAMAGAHLYHLDRVTDLGDKQTKQMSLLRRAGIGAARQYVAEAQFQPQRQRDPAEGNASLQLVFANTREAGLGVALPAGIVRVYQRDSRGELQFQGEDRLPHTAEGGKVRLRLGADPDLPVRRVQTAYQKVSGDVWEAAWEVTARNAKAEPVTVLVRESLPGDWQILDQSAEHRKETAQTVVWPLPVPAGGEAVLRYRVRVKGY